MCENFFQFERQCLHNCQCCRNFNPPLPKKNFYHVVKWNATIKETVHTVNNITIVYVTGIVRWQNVPVFVFFTFMRLCSLINLFFNKTKRRTNFPNLFCQETLHVSGSSCVHHQEFSTLHSALVYVMQIWWHISVLNVQWKTPDDGQRNCPKHVEFLNKINLGN